MLQWRRVEACVLCPPGEEEEEKGGGGAARWTVAFSSLQDPAGYRMGVVTDLWLGDELGWCGFMDPTYIQRTWLSSRGINNITSTILWYILSHKVIYRQSGWCMVFFYQLLVNISNYKKLTLDGQNSLMPFDCIGSTPQETDSFAIGQMEQSFSINLSLIVPLTGWQPVHPSSCSGGGKLQSLPSQEKATPGATLPSTDKLFVETPSTTVSSQLA